MGKVAAFIWVVIKIPQEWWIHVANLDFTHFVAHILPGADTRITSVVVATAYLIAVNTVLSQFPARRGVSWRDTAVQVTWMTLANLVVVVVSTAVLGSAEQATPWRTTAFVVALLTLIVVLYDRSHGIFADQQAQRIRSSVTEGPEFVGR